MMYKVEAEEGMREVYCEIFDDLDELVEDVCIPLAIRVAASFIDQPDMTLALRFHNGTRWKLRSWD